MSLAPELILREVAQRAIQTLQKYPKLAEALCEAEERLKPGITKDFQDKLKMYPTIQVVANYPTPDLSLPNVSIVTQSASESETFLGDFMGEDIAYAMDDAVGGLSELLDANDEGTHPVSASDVLGWYDDATFRIVVTTLHETFTALLAGALRFLLFYAKHRLEAIYGINNVSLSVADFAFPQDYWPALTWSKSITLKANVATEVSSRLLQKTEDSQLWEDSLPSIRDIIAEITVIT